MLLQSSGIIAEKQAVLMVYWHLFMENYNLQQAGSCLYLSFIINIGHITCYFRYTAFVLEGANGVLRGFALTNGAKNTISAYNRAFYTLGFDLYLGLSYNINFYLN